MEGAWKKCQMTDVIMSNNISPINYALKISPWYWPHGDGVGPRTQPRFMEGVWKKCQVTNFIMFNNASSMNYTLKSVPGLAEVGVPHGDGDSPRTAPRCLGDLEKISND